LIYIELIIVIDKNLLSVGVKYKKRRLVKEILTTKCGVLHR